MKKFDELRKSRSDPSYWAQNIIDSEKLCETDKERRCYYQYIMNPHTYCESRAVSTPTLGDLEKQGLLKDERADLPDCFFTTYKSLYLYKHNLFKRQI